MRYTKEQVGAATEMLKKHLEPNDTIYVILRYQATSGGSRVLSFFIFPKGTKIDLTWSVALVLDLGFDPGRRGVRDRSSPGFAVEDAHSFESILKDLSKALFKSEDKLKGTWL